ALRPGEIGDDVLDGARLRSRERIGQAFDNARAQSPVAGAAVAGWMPRMRAHEAERELAGEEVVVGKAGPGRPFRGRVIKMLGTMEAVHRVCQGRKAARVEPLGILPLG